MTNGQARTDAPDPKATFASKYSGEAAEVAHLLEQNSAEAAKRLQLDAHMKPHEFQAFMKDVQSVYAADKSKNPDLPNVIFANDAKNGVKVGVDTPGAKETPIIFESKPDQVAKANDKPVPMTGELLGLSKEQTKQILDIQAQEKQAGKGVHKFGDIAVSLGMKKPEEVNAALDQQDHLRAKQLADDLSTSMPVDNGEGYYQLLKRTHPELSGRAAYSLAHTIKKLNHGNEVLIAGHSVTVLNDKQKGEFEASAYETIHKRTGHVTAKFQQPLSEIPT